MNICYTVDAQTYYFNEENFNIPEKVTSVVIVIYNTKDLDNIFSKLKLFLRDLKFAKKFTLCISDLVYDCDLHLDYELFDNEFNCGIFIIEGNILSVGNTFINVKPRFVNYFYTKINHAIRLDLFNLFRLTIPPNILDEGNCIDLSIDDQIVNNYRNSIPTKAKSARF